MISRRYILLVAALVISSQLFAQVDKSVEVTREYIPQLERAEKPTLKAEVVDTATIRPEVDYTIMPLSISTSVATKPIDPTQVTYWQFSQPDNVAVKAGFGLPLMTLFDGYYSRYNADSGYFLASVNHYGEYVDLENPFSGESCANKQSNGVALAGGLHFNKRKLRTSFDYSNDLYHRSAAVIDSKDLSRAKYQDINFDFTFGDDFIDLSRWNFSLGFDAEYFWNIHANDNTIFGGEFNIARKYSKGSSLALSTAFHTLIIGDGDKSRDAGIIDIDFLYGYTRDSWELGVGFIYKGFLNQYIDDNGAEQNSTLFTPQVYFNYNFSGKTSLFATMGGDMVMGNYATMAKINPYILSSGFSSMRSTISSNLAVGVQGSLMRRNQLSYRLYAQGDISKDDMLWVLVVEPTNENYNYMAVEYIDQKSLSFNLEAEYRIIPQLTLSTDLHLNLYSKSQNSDGYKYGKSLFEGGLALDYSLPKFNFGVSAVSRSGYSVSYIYDIVTRDVELPATVDLGCHLDFKIGRDAAIFVEANNLINQTIYQYYGYRELGINFMAGVKFSF